MPTQPVVLWISKGKIVVSQTYANLSAGKYADNLSGFVVNPRNTGYFLPLLDLASSATYWPDFLVWIDNRVVVIDTKGDHLLQEATASKLFEIDTADGTPAKVILRLVSEGQSQLTTQGALARLSPRGLTVWRWRNGKPNSIHCEDEREAVRLALDLS
jgi:type III restriction enzyme